MSIWERLAEKVLGGILDRLLPTKRPEKKRAPGELDSADVAIQNRASHPPEAHKKSPRYRPHLVSEGTRSYECGGVGSLHPCPDCSPSSPRAIVERPRPTIVPPPRKRR